jgi:lipopolysaccharide assembly outer membrane protein LptD (OstA)
LSGLKEKVLYGIARALEALDDLKLSVVHVSRGAAIHVPGSVPTYAETLTDVSIVFIRYEAKEIDNDRILASDWKGLVFPATGLPDIKVSDLIRVDTDNGVILAGDYRIMYDDKVMVGNTIGLHQLQLRLT